MNKSRIGLFLIPICIACLVGCNKSVKELPLHFESIENNDSYQIETYIRYHFDDNDTIAFSFDNEKNDALIVQSENELIATKIFSNITVSITKNGVVKKIYLSSFEGETYQKSIKLCFGLDENGIQRFYYNYQDKLYNLDVNQFLSSSSLYGDIIYFSHCGDSAWVNWTDSVYGGYYYVDPRVVPFNVFVKESIIQPFVVSNDYRLVPQNSDVTIVGNDFELAFGPNSEHVALNQNHEIVEIKDYEIGTVFYGSCSVCGENQYDVHAFYTYNPRQQ